MSVVSQLIYAKKVFFFCTANCPCNYIDQRLLIEVVRYSYYFDSPS